MNIIRWLNKWYANWFGYFWLPCPLCGEFFGGHEGIFVGLRGNQKAVCSECGKKIENDGGEKSNNRRQRFFR